MISDVPIGSFLSGGVDSSAVTAFMAKNSSKKIKTFSIGFSDPKFDETQYSKQIAKKYDTEHYYVKINSKIFKEELPKISNYYDEPFADNSLIPTLFLSRFAKREVTVALSGDGGDENFAGYDRYNIVAFGNIYKKVPKLLRKGIIKPITNSLFSLSPNLFTSRLKSFAESFEAPFYKRYITYKSFFSQIDKNKIFSDYMKSLNLNDTYLIDKDRYNNKLSNLDNALKADLGSYMPEDLLYKIDIASMSTSLEVRAPLLDYKLMELTAKMPDDLRIKNFNMKYIFKKMLVEKNILPNNVVYRPKRGFNAPIGNWLKNDLKEYVIEQLSNSKFRQTQIFDNNNLDNYIKDYYSGNLNYHNNIFALLVLSNWIQKNY
jgi:asparagine synthase (glutamine-hydrolysing)